MNSPDVSSVSSSASSAAVLQAAERRHPWLALAAVCTASVAVPLAFTGPAIALQAIARDFNASPLALAWVTNAFMLAFGSSLMVAGALADRHGRRRVLRAGLLLFIVSSVAAAFSPNIHAVDAFRALQGLASAAILAGGSASLAQAFEGAAQVRAFSLVGTSFGIGLALGPVAAGWLLSHFGWRSIFGLVVAMVLLSAVLGARSLRESRDPQAQSLDWPGALSFTLALSCFTAAVLQVPVTGLGHPATLAGFAVSVLLGLAFVAIERCVPRPMLDLTLFRYPRFVGVQMLAGAPAYAFVVLLVMLPIRFVGIEGLSALEAGRLMAAMSVPLVVLPVLAGQLTRFCSPAAICGAGLAVCAAGLLWLSKAANAQAALPPMALIGIGISFPWGLMDGMAVSVVPKERAGMATGIFSTTRVAGEGLAMAWVGSALAGLISWRLPGGHAAVAQELAAGRLEPALQQAPAIGRALMTQAYLGAFSNLMVGLAVITALTAMAVFVVLNRRDPAEAGARLKPVTAEKPARRASRLTDALP